MHHFTVGQRKGLGIATGEPLYVIATDARSQRVTVGSNDELLRASLTRVARSIGFRLRAAGARPARSEDPQQARGRAGDAISIHGGRAGRSAIRRAAAGGDARSGSGVL